MSRKSALAGGADRRGGQIPYGHARPAGGGDESMKQQKRNPAIPHPDDVAGALSRVLGVFARPAANTLAELDAYRRLPVSTLFPAPRELPAVRVTSRWRLPGLVSEDVVFPSLHEPIEARFRQRYRNEYGETHTVYARRIRPSSALRRPRLLYLHGYMQPETYLEEFSLLAGMALRLNVEVVQLQPPYHGRRTPRGSRFGGELYWTADLVRSVEALRQNVLDARTLLGWLLEEDPRPVGVSGLSLGGALALILTCLDSRFAFSAPLIAHMDLAALVADAPVLARARAELRRFGWGDDDFRKFVTEIGWYDLRPKLPPERIHLFTASDDRFFDPAIVEAMWRRWERPPIRWYPCSHMGFIAHLPEALRVMREFIDGCEAARTHHRPPRMRRSAARSPSHR
jgi:Alpha/beta hydrolase domain containing 18